MESSLSHIIPLNVKELGPIKSDPIDGCCWYTNKSINNIIILSQLSVSSSSSSVPWIVDVIVCRPQPMPCPSEPESINMLLICIRCRQTEHKTGSLNWFNSSFNISKYNGDSAEWMWSICNHWEVRVQTSSMAWQDKGPTKDTSEEDTRNSPFVIISKEL